MADTSFKSSVSENDLINFLQGFITLGKITSSSLLEQANKEFDYRLQCNRKSVKLILAVTNASSFSSFGLDLFRLEPERTRAYFKSDNPLKIELDSVVQKAVSNYMSNKHIAGLSVGVIKNGKSYSYNFGEVKKGTNQLPTNKTMYDIGSISKTFTGILLANAVFEGKIRLDDDIRKYLKGNYPNLQYNNTPVQVVHLANHTSRIPTRPTITKTDISPMDETFTGNLDNKMLSEILTHISIDTLPGTKREYSNFAVCILGKILENVYHLTYEQLLNKYITIPYQMKQTKITLSKNDMAYYAQGYSLDGSIIPYWTNNAVNAVGGIRSTVSDMLLFMQQQLKANNKVATLSHQVTFGNEKDGIGLLWGISRTKSNNHLRWTHDGSTDGFSSVIWVIPEINSGVVILTNNGDFFDESFSNEIYKTIYNYLVAKK